MVNRRSLRRVETRQTFRVLPGQFAHEGAFPDRGKTNEAYTGNACTGNIETGYITLAFFLQFSYGPATYSLRRRRLIVVLEARA